MQLVSIANALPKHFLSEFLLGAMVRQQMFSGLATDIAISDLTVKSSVAKAGLWFGKNVGRWQVLPKTFEILKCG
jgi:hypothetical protein